MHDADYDAVHDEGNDEDDEEDHELLHKGISEVSPGACAADLQVKGS